MATFSIHCADPWFTHILEGRKPVEGRKNTHTYHKIQQGDTICFTNGKKSFEADVIEIRKYSTLEDYFADVTLEKALPDVATLEEGIAIYLQWSTEAQIQQYGFIGIFVRPRELAPIV